jgi:hypothetical protein
MSNFVIFHLIKVAKHIWDPCRYLATESDSGFSLIDQKQIFKNRSYYGQLKNFLF